MMRTSVFLMLLMGGNFVASLVMNRVLSRTYGATAVTDVFFRLLMAVPFFLFTVFDNLFQTCVIPQVTALRSRKPQEEVFRMLQAAATAIGLILLVVVGALWVFQGSILRFLEPEWVGQGGAVPASMARWLFPSVFFLGLAVFGKHVLNSLGTHYLAAVVSLPRQVVLALTVFLLAGAWGLEAAAVGFFLGSLCQFIPVAVGLMRHRFRPVWPNGNDWREVGRFFAFLGFPAVGVTLLYLFGPIEAYLGQFLDEGAMTTLFYSRRICGILGLVFWSSLTVVTHTRASEAWGAGNKEEALRTLVRALRYGLFIGVPGALLGLTCRYLVLGVVLAGKQFGPEDLEMTANHMTALLPATLAVIFSGFFSSFLLTARKTKTHALFNSFCLAIMVFFYLLTIFGLKMDRYALSVGYGLACFVIAPVSYLVFRWKVASIPIGSLLAHGGKVLAASLVACLLPYLLVSGFVDRAWETSTTGLEGADFHMKPAILGLTASFALFTFVFLAVARMLRIGECNEVLGQIPILRRVVRTPR